MRFKLGFAVVGVALGILRNGAAAATKDGPRFDFARDTFAFANQMFFDYRGAGGRARPSSPGGSRSKEYTSRCFVMSRGVVQFWKFARFDSKLPPLDDADLSHRLRVISHQRPWEAPWPKDRRVVIPGYRDLRDLSEKRTRVVQESIGLGWPTYFRLGNWRMACLYSHGYEVIEYAELEDALRRGEFFVAYLTSFPSLSINHGVLVYAHRSLGRDRDTVRYWVYDPNHPEKPRELDYSLSKREFSFEKDWDFVGGFVRVYHVYGKAWQ